MNYEIQQKLNDKADKWELHNVQNENRELKSQIRELERRIDYLEGVNQNRYSLLQNLLDLLIQMENSDEFLVKLYELKNYL